MEWHSTPPTVSLARQSQSDCFTHMTRRATSGTQRPKKEKKKTTRLDFGHPTPAPSIDIYKTPNNINTPVDT